MATFRSNGKEMHCRDCKCPSRNKRWRAVIIMIMINIMIMIVYFTSAGGADLTLPSGTTTMCGFSPLPSKDPETNSDDVEHPYCALDAPGYFNKQHFEFHLMKHDYGVDQENDLTIRRTTPTSSKLSSSSCPWVDFAAILRQDEAMLSSEELHQKRLLLGRPRNILLIGDSQDRNTITHHCESSWHSELHRVRPRWTLPGSTEIHSSRKQDSHFCVCKIGNLTMANFFHFGLMGYQLWLEGHTSREDNEPTTASDRILRMLPSMLEDAFESKEVRMDATVIHSGLWDLMTISCRPNWRQMMDTLLSSGDWPNRSNTFVSNIRDTVSSLVVYWRNMPDIVEERTAQTFNTGSFFTNPFTSKHVEMMNHVGTSTAKSLGLPVVDWRGSLVGVVDELTESDGFHARNEALDVYINRILNAVVNMK